MKNNKTVAIIGAGIGGLTAGYELSKKGYKVTVFEKEKEIGGLLSDFEIEGEKIEKFYHHIFKTDTEIINLIEELGLKEKLKWYKSSTGICLKGKVYPFNGVIDLLKFEKLDLISKFRLGLIYLWLKFDNNFSKYENISAVEWMEKLAGKNAYKVIWKPLLKGKFHKDYKKVAMAWLWARIHTRGGSKGGPADAKAMAGKEVLGYMDGGFGQINNKLIKNLKVQTLCPSGISLDRAISDFDMVIDTRPIEGVDYIGAVDVVFSSSQSLSKYYWHNVNDLKSPFLVLVQHNNLLKDGGYNGKNIYYLGTYVPQNHKYFRISEGKIAKEFLKYLPKIFNKFDIDQVDEIRVFKSKYAQHIVSQKYKVPSYKVGEKTYRLNFAQIYPEDRGINFAVKEARKLVKMIEDDNQ